MSQATHSVAMTTTVHESARRHLLRADGQEDLTFALWRPSRGCTRMTALIETLILPREGDRTVHGNVSFHATYLQRAMTEAAKAGAGLALLHSHPLGRQWQDMSSDDIAAEQGNAAAVYGATRLSFVGLTVAADGAWSARFWERVGPRRYARRDCATVRVVGDRLQVTYMNKLAPPPATTGEQIRTVSAWGERAQQHLARLRVGVIGAGSVGSFIAEGLARTGCEDVIVIDYDRIERKNLDRLLYATRRIIHQLKAVALGDRLREVATARRFEAIPVPFAVYEEEGFRAALDCDVLFSCVDRPWGRHVLNFIAYAHLIPVIDGGISVRKNRKDELTAADWRAHTVTADHRCMECIGQYDTGLVQLEREGRLDDPTYIQNLAKDHPLRVSENVFAFSMACAAQQMLQMLAMVVAPLGRANPGEQLYHFVGAHMEPPKWGTCQPECLFPTLIAQGDHSKIDVTGPKPPGRDATVERIDEPPTARRSVGERVRTALRAAVDHLKPTKWITRR
ncbi:ThiF family adenylyltransferase (plasmid) [Bradyrhizobium sp. CCGUVB1N3]|uniref:ThiF family adenylyltransferase n=1 Tax=Bradyrhizobium sp. CCGUVB1N3 TaxID=2949629 RepID=UPI0020B19CE1|nr:ThiF family adenylyltransferase [Bradyrhizobium sp. CCGUVB1N3]MCP3478033.1 ThiF family adenylyltransferase [Bradyrhizobium sp. CCGUVB1N3]